MARRVLRAADQALGRVDRVVLGICAVLLASLVVVIIAIVFFRYVLNSSLMWGEELARLIAAWLVFLGLSCAHRRSEHVAVKSLLRKIPGISDETARRIGEVIVLAICAIVVLLGFMATIANFERNQLTAALQIPIGWGYLSIPVGFTLLGLQSLLRVFMHVPEPQPEATLEDNS